MNKMDIPFFDLKKQHREIQSTIDSAIAEIHHRGIYLQGPEVIALEKEFADYCGSKHSIAVASGTDALMLSLMSINLESGDEVITVPNTAFPTAAAISQAQGIPKFVDVDPQTYTMNPQKLKDAITSKTKAIIPVHLFGQSADLDPIINICKKQNLSLIEDACQAHGALYKNNKIGTLGDLGCFSFYPTKNLGGIGDGGMIITNNSELASKLNQLKNYGQDQRYFHKIKGINSRLGEIQAALLRIKLKKLNYYIEERRKRAALYCELLNSTPVVLPFQAIYSHHSFHLFIIQCEERDKLKEHLLINGINTMIHYPLSIHLQEAYKELHHEQNNFSISETLSKKILSLPLYPELELSKIEYIANKICQFYQS